MTKQVKMRALWALAAIATSAACKPTPYREVEVDVSGGSSAERLSRPRATRTPLRFSVAAMQSPQNTYAAYSRLFSRVGQLLGTEIELVQRRTYREVNDMLLSGHLDAAFLCTGGYLDLRKRHPGSFEPLVVPVIEGKTTYAAVVIVPASSTSASLESLRGTRFAFTDELSLSGHAYVMHRLRTLGEEPRRFFAKTTFTNSHDRSVEVVASGLAEGAVVDSLVYEQLVASASEPARGTRVIDRSPPLGMMPIVTAAGMSREMRHRLRDVLLSLHRDAGSGAAMRVTRIERFEEPAPGLYDVAATIMEAAR